MNGGMIRFILGSVLKVESVLLLFPCIVAVFYNYAVSFSVFSGICLFFFCSFLFLL